MRAISGDDDDTAAVGFQFGTAGGTSEVIVSVAGTRVNIRKTVDVLIGDETDEQLSINSNTRDSGNANVFNLVARVEDKDGDPVWGKSVTFRTRFGNLESTPTGESFDHDDDGNNENIESDMSETEELVVWREPLWRKKVYR